MTDDEGADDGATPDDVATNDAEPSDSQDAGTDPESDSRAAGDDAGSGGEFARRVAEARDLIDDDATAFYVGVVREGREVDSTFAQQADDAQQE
ncbi:MAG: hypothetical protein ACOCSD_08180, partial [Halolamina sp.]